MALGGDRGRTEEKQVRQPRFIVSVVKLMDAVRLATGLRSIMTAILFVTGLAAASAQTGQRTYATAQEAAQALIDAVTTEAMSELEAILGPNAKTILSSGDAVADQIGFESFRAAAKEAVVLNQQAPDRVVVSVGEDRRPFRIPIVEKAGAWFFDTEAANK
jgi:hypothetical protein